MFPLMVYLTPKRGSKYFLKIRELMNGYVHEECIKEVRVTHTYDEEPDATFSPLPLSFGLTTPPSTPRLAIQQTHSRQMEHVI